jgi:hypothetical protein
MKAVSNKTRTIPPNETVARNGEMILSLRGKGVYLFPTQGTTGHYVCSIADFQRSKANILKEGWTLDRPTKRKAG